MSSTRIHFDLLGVEPSASLDEIKQSYRRQMARYHPDKLQHLGQEFLDLASKRAADLTQAYDAVRRQRAAGVTCEGAAAGVAPQGEPDDTPGPEVGIDNDFLSQAALSTLRQVAESVLEDPLPRRLPGFDVAIASQPTRRLFRRAALPVLLLGRVLPEVGHEAVQTAWRDVARLAGDPDHVRSLFLMSRRLASARDLAEAIALQRGRPVRAGAGIVIVPVDLQSWRSLVPSDAPEIVKTIIAELSSAR